MNVHTPERQADETQRQYRQRHASSRRIVEQSRQPTQAPAVSPLDVSRFWLGQHHNEAKRNRRAAIAAIGRRQFLKHSKAARRAA